MIIGPVTLRFPHLFEPSPFSVANDKPKYTAEVSWPKEDTKTTAAVQRAIDEAVAVGLEKRTFTPAQTNLPKFLRPLKDGDELSNKGETRPDLVGRWWLRFNSTQPVPVLVLRGGKAEHAKPDEMYSGAIVKVQVSSYPYNMQGGAMGVSFGFDAIMKTGDGVRADGRATAQSAAAAFGVELGAVSDFAYRATEDGVPATPPPPAEAPAPPAYEFGDPIKDSASGKHYRVSKVTNASRWCTPQEETSIAAGLITGQAIDDDLPF